MPEVCLRAWQASGVHQPELVRHPDNPRRLPGTQKGPGVKPGPLRSIRSGSPYEAAFILRSMASMTVSRLLLRFSYSRTFLSWSTVRASSRSETSPTLSSS